MNAATTNANVRTLTDDLATLILLLGDDDVDGAILCESRSGFAGGQLLVGAAYRGPLRRGLLPPSALDPFEGTEEVVFTVSPAIRASNNSRYVLATAVAFVRWTLEPAFIGGVWRIPSEPRANVLTAIDGFACQPSAVIDAGREIVAIWRLARPFDLVTEDGYLGATRLQQRLANALGGSRTALPHIVHSGSGPNQLEHINAHDPVGFLPIAGMQTDLGVRGARPLIRVRDLHPSRVYTAEQLDAAASTLEAGSSTRTKRAATAAKE